MAAEDRDKLRGYQVWTQFVLFAAAASSHLTVARFGGRHCLKLIKQAFALPCRGCGCHLDPMGLRRNTL